MRRLEDAGFAVDPAEPGCAYFETRGSRAALRRPRAGAEAGAHRGRAGLGCARRRGDAAVRRARRRERRALGPGAGRLRRADAGVPRAAAVDAACRSRRSGARSSRSWGSRDLVSLLGYRAAPWPNDWGRTAGAPGAWREEARTRRVRGRRPPAELFETLEFPEAVGNELTLRRSLGSPRSTGCSPARSAAGRALRKLALSARLVGGGSWRRTMTLREPPPSRPACAPRSGPKLPSCPRRGRCCGSRLLVLAESHRAAARARAAGGRRAAGASAAKACARCARAPASGSVCTVVEVAPWSRLPEQRALLVPRDD